MKFKLVFFDCDGVLTKDNLWKRLHKLVGLSEHLDNKWFNDYYSGKIPFVQWIKKIERFYQQHNISRQHLKKAFSKIGVNPEAKKIISHLQNKKIKTAIISSGIDLYVKKYAKVLKIDVWRANYSLIFDNNDRLVQIKYTTDDPIAKVRQIKEICKTTKISPTETMFVGDSVNDFEAFKLTRHGVLYKPKNKEYEKFAWKTINHLSKIRELLKYQL